LGGFAGGALGAYAVGGYGYGSPTYVSYGGGGGGSYAGGDTIVVNGTSEPVAEYAQQATTIADNYDDLSKEVVTPPATTAGAPAAPLSTEVQDAIAKDWMPLGMYALTEENNRADPTQYVQLLVSKSGAVGGELHDLTSDTSTPLTGAVDQQSQRVAWKVGSSGVVMETGLYNLTQSETPVLVHDSTGKTRQMVMARVEDPKLAQAETAQPTTTGAPQPVGTNVR
jgi:hypothetical protein